MKEVDLNDLLEEDARLRKLQRMVNMVCSMILMSDYEDIDVKIAQEEVREECMRLFPDKMDLYEMVYGARFKRLWEQFRLKERGQD